MKRACVQCRDCISAALAASKILRKLAQESGEHDGEEAKDMREHADHYETHAIGTFKHNSYMSFIVSVVTFNLVSQVSSVNVTPGILSELRNCSSVSHRPGADARVCGSLWRRTTKDSSLTQEFR